MVSFCAKGMDKDAFDQEFTQAFLGNAIEDFPKWMHRFEKGLPYKQEWLQGKRPMLRTPCGNFLSLMDVMWKWRWRSEEHYISHKLELLEARLYRVAEERFPDWERWRMVDRVEELKDHLLSFSGELRNSLVEIVEPRWGNEYAQAFTHKYLFRIENVLKSMTPPTPRPPETLVKIGTDYGCE